MAHARSPRAFPLADWPDVDREAWERASAGGDAFVEGGAASRWAERTRENAQLAYGRLLAFLSRAGRLHPVRRVGERLVTEDLCAMGRELAAQLAPYTVLSVFTSLNQAFSAMDPSVDRTVLNTLASRLSQTVACVRDIPGNLIAPSDLVAIGERLMERAERQTSKSFRRASLYRDGLLLAFMALCPLRPGAVSEMRLGTHLLVDGDRVALHMPVIEARKRRPEHVPLPVALQARFLRYLVFYRTMSAAPPGEYADAVWLSRHGLPLTRGVLSKRVKERVGRETGKRFSAHMFRHAAASYIVDAAPEQALMVAGVLGHSGLRTAQRHYIKGQQHMAARAYQAAVKRLRVRAKKRGKAFDTVERRSDLD